jgi:hypothetical protein
MAMIRSSAITVIPFDVGIIRGTHRAPKRAPEITSDYGFLRWLVAALVRVYALLEALIAYLRSRRTTLSR